MRYCVSVTASEKKIEEHIELFKVTNVRYAEVSFEYREGMSYDSYIGDYCNKFIKNNIEIVSIHAPLWPGNISSLDETEREDLIEHFKKIMSVFAGYFSGKIVVVHPGELIEKEKDRREHYM